MSRLAHKGNSFRRREWNSVQSNCLPIIKR